MTNEQLKQIIQKIEEDKEGNVDIYLRLFDDLGLEKAVMIDKSILQRKLAELYAMAEEEV